MIEYFIIALGFLQNVFSNFKRIFQKRKILYMIGIFNA